MEHEECLAAQFCTFCTTGKTGEKIDFTHLIIIIIIGIYNAPYLSSIGP